MIVPSFFLTRCGDTLFTVFNSFIVQQYFCNPPEPKDDNPNDTYGNGGSDSTFEDHGFHEEK